MKTIRAKDLTKKSILIDDYNNRIEIDRVDVTRRGNIMLWVGEDGATVKFYDPMDVVVIE